MKKSFITLVCLLACLSTSFANDKQKENVDKKYTLTSGYRGMVDFGYTVGVGTYNLGRVSLLTSHGYQFTPYIFMGAGMGVNIFHEAEISNVPVFAHLKGTFMKGRVIPFAELKIGYALAEVSGFYMNPSVGCRMGINKNLGLNFSLGYEVQQTEMLFYNDQTSFYSNKNLGGFLFKVGIDF